MDVRDAPTTPTMDFRSMDDSATFEFFDGSSRRKRRRSSLRRVSFAEKPSIHVFARDDDYETPPEGTMSHLSAQSTPTSVSRSPQRRSERLAGSRGGRRDENEVDKENVPTSVGSSVRQSSKRGRRPLAPRDVQKEKEEEFLKPSNWLDNHENSAFGSCDENTGPVDLRHITMGDQSMAVADDENMTMDSQTFHTRMSQMFPKQPLHRLSEGPETATTTSRHYSDMELTVAWPEKQVQERERKLLDQPTWHRGDGDVSDMSQGSYGELSIFKVIAKKKSRMESGNHDTEENTMEGGDNWTEDDAQSQGRIPSLYFTRPGSLPGGDDTVSMETSSPISNGDRRRLFVDEGDRNANTRNVRDSEGSDGPQLQGSRTSKDTESYAVRPVVISKNRTSMFDYDDNVSMETTSQCHAGGNDSTMEIDSGTGERFFNRDVYTLPTPKESESTELACSAPQPRVHQGTEHNATLDGDHIRVNPSDQSGAGAGEESPVPLRHYERKLKRMSTSAAKKGVSVATKPMMDSDKRLSRSQGHAQSLAEEPVARHRIGQLDEGVDRLEPFLQQGTMNQELRKSIGFQAFDGFVHQDFRQGASLPAAGEDTDSMDITRTWNDHAPQHTSVPTKSSDSAKSFLWEDKDQHMDMSDVDMTDRYQEGITEAMPKLTSVLGGYNCDSPSVEPLNRIFQRRNDIDIEDSPVRGLTAEIDMRKENSSKKGDDIARNRAEEEKETVSNRGLEEDTEETQLNIGKKRTVFQNPEDTFSFKGHQKCTREASASKSLEQSVILRPAFPNVREKVDFIEANLRNQNAPQSLGQDFRDEDATADFTDQHNWRAEVSSDMSTTPLSPRMPSHFQRLVNKVQPILIDTRLTDSPSFQDGITANIPNVQDLLAADAETPESGLGWNPRKIVWSAQQSNLQALGDEVVIRQPGIDQMEDETMHSMPEKLCTPRAAEEMKPMFECMSEEGAMTLNQLSHSKEVKNSLASKILLRMMSLQDKGCAQAESSDAKSQQILRRTLHFQLESDSQLQSQSLRGDAEQQISARDPDGTMEVESVKIVDEEIDSNESRLESLEQETRRQKMLQEMQVAEERLLALERRSEELRKRAEDCHQAIAKRFRNDFCFEMKEMAVFGSQANFNKQKKQFQLLNCMQSWDLKTMKIGDDEVLHEFKYWSLFTHSVFERYEDNLEFTVFKSSIDLNEASINQFYRHMNASLAWRWFLSEHEEIPEPQSLFNRVQGVHSKMMILLDLMEEVESCRKYLVIPHFRLQTGSGLLLNLQFSDSKLLFDFVLSFDMRQVTNMWYSKSHEPDCASEMNQKLDCAVQIESAGRFFGKITEAEIKSSVASVVRGHEFLLRVCASINTLTLSLKDECSEPNYL